MSGWKEHEGLMVCLPMPNIDTDQIIPARFMSQPRIDGYQDFLFYDIRKNTEGELEPSFPLNRHSSASLLLCGKNFGSGSSREAAAYALHDAGIKVLVSESFGDIFSANAVNNGLLPARVSVEDIEMLFALVGPTAMYCKVNLSAQNFTIGDHTISFEIDASWKTKLVNGWDDIDITLNHRNEIKQYREQRSQTITWAWPVQKTNTGDKL